MFIIEGEDTDNLRIVKVVGPSGIIKNAFKDDNGKIYRFVQLKPDLNTMKKEEAKDVVIKLNKEEEEILKKAFDNLEFETAKAIIRESSLASLDELASLMQKKPNWRLKISGHTDNQGKPATNMQLSKNRALAVKNYLMTKGISEDRFKVEWFGQTKPIADNKTPEGRQKNRRVEMLIIE
jgi:outer membrane protein OmpA-like peptidoglycan-associated protein